MVSSLTGKAQTEDIKVMQNYNIPKNVIEKYKMSYNKNYKAYVELISYDKLLDDANKRNKILFDKYIDKFKKIQCVILHIEYTSLSEIVETKENSWRKYYYQSYMNLDVPSIKKYDFTKYFLSSTKNFNANTKLLLKYLKEKADI